MKDLTEEEISYRIVRTHRATTDIVIEPNGDVVVRAPMATPDARIRELVHTKRRWLHKHLSEWRELNASRVRREFKTGESFLYLGRTFQLTLVDDQDVPLRMLGDRLCLLRSLVDSVEPSQAKTAFREFYVAQGRECLMTRVAAYAPKLGVSPRSVDVRELSSRWGSCAPSGDVAFHWRCMMAPLTIVDYIVVHELCHLLHRNHTDAFWDEVDKVLPDFRERRDWLKRNGAGLDI